MPLNINFLGSLHKHFHFSFRSFKFEMIHSSTCAVNVVKCDQLEGRHHVGIGEHFFSFFFYMRTGWARP